MPIQYDSNGIITQDFNEIIEEREANLQDVMGGDFTIDATTPIGNMELADANNELTIQELIAWLLPNQIDANTAEGIFLDAICEKNRIYRKQPDYTKVQLKILGTAGTEFLSGDIIVSESYTGIYYDLNEDCTIGSDGYVVAEFKCEEFGANEVLTTSKLTIQTPQAGLDSIEIDILTFTISLGRDVETDAELRRRRELSVQQTSTNTLGAISSILYSTDGVKHVKCFENDAESTDANGVPMKSFEIVVDGGDADDITDVIFNNKPLGTRAYGTTVINKTDEYNNIYSIGYTKAEEVDVVIDISIQVSSLTSEAWKTKVKTAIKEKFDTIQDIGSNVKAYNYFSVIDDYSEVKDINSIKIRKSTEETSASSDVYVINSKQVAKISLNNIIIAETTS